MVARSTWLRASSTNISWRPHAAYDCTNPYSGAQSPHYKCCIESLLSSLWLSRTGSASDWCALQEALYKCIDAIQWLLLWSIIESNRSQSGYVCFPSRKQLEHYEGATKIARLHLATWCKLSIDRRSILIVRVAMNPGNDFRRFVIHREEPWVILLTRKISNETRSTWSKTNGADEGF